MDYRPSWTHRRRIIYGTLIFCAVIISWITFSSDSRPVSEVIIISAFGLAGTVIGAYVFGAAWDDKNIMQHHHQGKEKTCGCGSAPSSAASA